MLCGPTAPPRTIHHFVGPFATVPRPPARSTASRVLGGGTLTVLSINCGGAAANILSIAAGSAADVIFLQEVWEAFDVGLFTGSGFTPFSDGVFSRGGGLVTLLHHTFLGFSLRARGPRLSSTEGLLVCDCSLRDGSHLVLANVYLRPRQPWGEWEAVLSCIRSFGHLPSRPALIVGRDFNEVLGSPRKRGRVGRALHLTGGWSFLHVPYVLGEFTNLVSRGGRVSKSEIDYILLGKETPFLVEGKGVLPGVSSHGALCISFSLPPLLVSLRNPAEKVLNFKCASLGDQRSLCACLGLLLWLNPSADPDTLLPKFHAMAAQLLPRPSVQSAIAEAPLLRDLGSKALQGNPHALVQIEMWRQRLRDSALWPSWGCLLLRPKPPPLRLSAVNFFV